MVVLGKKDLNVSYQIGKKRQLNESLSSLVINLENEDSDEIIFEKDPKNENGRVLKRPKYKMENEGEKSAIKKRKENSTQICEANAYSTGLHKEELEDKNVYNSRLFCNNSDEVHMMGFNSSGCMCDADASFIDCLNASPYSLASDTPDTPDITSTPLKEKCRKSRKSRKSISKAKDAVLKYQCQDNFPIVPCFSTKGVYLSEKRKLTPYNIDRLVHDSFLSNENVDDLHQRAISSSVITIIESD